MVEQAADVYQHVPERAEFPVEDGGDAAVGLQDHIAWPIVGVDEPRVTLRGFRGQQSRVDRIDDGQITGLRLLPDGPHALDLSRQLVFTPAQIAEADRVYVDAMQFGECIHETEGQASSRGFVRHDAGHSIGPVDDGTIDPIHDVERRARHGRIDARA